MNYSKPDQLYKKIALIVLAAAIIAAVAVFAFRSGNPKIKHGTKVYNVINSFLKQSQYSLDVTAEIKTKDESYSTEASIIKTMHNDKEITAFIWNGITLYYADEIFYLENGTAFEAGENFADYRQLIVKTGDIYNSIDVSKDTLNENDVYTVSVTDKNIFTQIMELAGDKSVTNIPDLQMVVTVRDNLLQSIEFYANDGNYNAQKDEAGVYLKIQVTDIKYELPSDIAEKIVSGTNEEHIQLSDIQLLAEAWNNYFEYEISGADVSVNLNCAFLNINETFTMLSTKVSDKTVVCIKRGSLELFIVDGQLYTERWGTLTDTETAVFSNAEKIIEICYRLCLSQNFEISHDGEKTFYSVELSAQDFEQLMQLLTQRKDIKINMDGGRFAIEVAGDSIINMHFECNGSIDIVISEVSAEIAVNVNMYEGDSSDIDIPESLKQ